MYTIIVITVFVAGLVGFVAVSRRRGARAHYLEDWQPDEGERVLLSDDSADFYVAARYGQAVKMSFARRGRARVRVTDRRIVVAAKVALADKWMITHVLVRDGAPIPEGADRIDSGLMSTGYTTLAMSRMISAERDGDHPYVRLVPQPVGSAENVEHCRLYSDQTDSIVAILEA